MNQHLGKGSAAMSCQNQPKKFIKTHCNKWQKIIILKAARHKKCITYGIVPIRLPGDFSSADLEVRREWEVLKV